MVFSKIGGGIVGSAIGTREEGYLMPYIRHEHFPPLPCAYRLNYSIPAPGRNPVPIPDYGSR
ncbi:MAG: hypothetical protein LJE96_17680 [Deltaproteobacteria bacterium]|nr:hypothetical protein [Deltaproteobacteria bacterium]